LIEIDRLQAEVDALKAHLAALRSQVSEKETAIAEHDRRRPNRFLGRLDGTLIDHVRTRAALELRAGNIRKAEAKAQTAVSTAETRLLTAKSRWNASMAVIMQARRDQEHASLNDLALYGRTRQLALRNALLAAAGCDAVLAHAHEQTPHETPSAWNGLSWTDAWGVGQTGPSLLV
jgi:hypothetical protein